MEGERGQQGKDLRPECSGEGGDVKCQSESESESESESAQSCAFAFVVWTCGLVDRGRSRLHRFFTPGLRGSHLMLSKIVLSPLESRDSGILVHSFGLEACDNMDVCSGLKAMAHTPFFP